LQQLCHIGPFQKLIAYLDALMFNNQKAEYSPTRGFTLIISILSGRGNADGYNCSLYPRRD